MRRCWLRKGKHASEGSLRITCAIHRRRSLSCFHKEWLQSELHRIYPPPPTDDRSPTPDEGAGYHPLHQCPPCSYRNQPWQRSTQMKAWERTAPGAAWCSERTGAAHSLTFQGPVLGTIFLRLRKISTKVGFCSVLSPCATGVETAIWMRLGTLEACGELALSPVCPRASHRGRLTTILQGSQLGYKFLTAQGLSSLIGNNLFESFFIKIQME